MILVDTGFFLALFNPRDTLHPRANAWANFLEVPLLVTEYVFWECANAWSAVRWRSYTPRLWEHLQTEPGYILLPANDLLITAGMELYTRRGDKSWSLTDCISFTVMQSHGVHRALTHDHHFEEAGFEALLRRDPV